MVLKAAGDVLTYLRERVKEVLTGASSSIVVRIYGSDINVLRAKAKEGIPFGLELVIRGAEQSLIPILMTVLTTALALLPLAVSGNKSGYEIKYPLAVVIVGGLVTLTFLHLFLLPPLYLLWGRNAVSLSDEQPDSDVP